MPVNCAPTRPITDPAWKITSSCTPTRSRTSELLRSLRVYSSPAVLIVIVGVSSIAGAAIVARRSSRATLPRTTSSTNTLAWHVISFRIKRMSPSTTSIERREKMRKVRLIICMPVRAMLTVHISPDQFKVIDTRRVKVPARHSKSVMNQQNKVEHLIERSLPPVSASSPATVVSSSPPSQVQTPHSHASTSSPNEAQTPPDYRLLLAWSYYLASQAAWLSPMFQQQGQLPSSLPTDPQACAKFLQQAMQTAMDPSRNGGSLPNNEQSATECQSRRDQRPFAVKEEANGS